MQVLLLVNVGVHFFRDPIIEILQFEKYQERNWFPENQENLNYSNYDPCRELLKLSLHVDNTLSSTIRSLPPPRLSSNSGFGSASQNSPLLFLSFFLILEVTPCHHCLEILLHLRNLLKPKALIPTLTLKIGISTHLRSYGKVKNMKSAYHSGACH